jgi:hypothetical protein
MGSYLSQCCKNRPRPKIGDPQNGPKFTCWAQVWHRWWVIPQLRFRLTVESRIPMIIPSTCTATETPEFTNDCYWCKTHQSPVYIYICLAVSLQWLHLQTVPLFASPARRALCVVGGTTARSRNFAQLQHMNWSKGGCSKKKLEIDVAHPCSIEGGSGLWETMAATHSSSKHGNMFGCLTPVAALANGSPFC